MEKKALDAEIESLRKEAEDTKRGQIFGFIIGVAAVISGTASAVMGAQWAGALIGGGLVSLVSAFIVGRKNPQQNNSNQISKEVADTEEK